MDCVLATRSATGRTGGTGGTGKTGGTGGTGKSSLAWLLVQSSSYNP